MLLEAKNKIILKKGMGPKHLKVSASRVRLPYDYKLAQRLREVLPEEIARASRPCKTVELRVLDLNDTTTPKEVTQEISRERDCTINIVSIIKKVDEISFSHHLPHLINEPTTDIMV